MSISRPTSQDAIDGDGRLILSEFTGSASELTEAISCNPFDTDGLSHVIEDALDLSGVAARERIHAMADMIRRCDIHRWARNELAQAPARHIAWATGHRSGRPRSVAV